MFLNPTFSIRSLVAFFLLVILIAGCNGNPPTALTPAPAQTEIATSNVQPPAEQPSPTPPPAQVWLVIPNGSETTANEIKTWLEDKAVSQNFIFEVHPPSDLENLPANLRLVIFSGPDAQTSAWEDRFPQTGLIILNDDSTEASQNVSVIRSTPILQAFIAGFITTLIAPDFRSGALFNQNDPLLSQLQDGFINGGRYLCGRCAPVYAPIVFFPQTSTFNPAGEVQDWIAAFDSLHQNRLETLYLADPFLLEPQLLEAISRQNVAFLTTQTPAEDWRSQWIATLQVDRLTALENAWESWQNAEPGKVWQAGIRIAEFNPDRLTEGKLNLALKTLNDLENGWIYPLSIP
ncbi:hypothetical protein BECAL_02702 [Bellilinea caldifistulae]|uniref:Uncharacterized protein n=1 Tax=Bellilinea caldifistulae TaxID=360411 RepID=A0A0P6X3R6_9CHLR|nr:hypothetical protein [Bellilinea caldifistulae]KPL75945.1 hypothetical protein AC812_08255 [Bellilinea caldifistulae]GAP11513.1 hypothetical protein BECAL_02702 [Bellilinea caldifistulae]